ncbi:MAG: glycosyltransferase [Candidatus Omnitrophica bacterium]|nr:glycosyltransferase [Candidatus Omnitrophota bacterium]
MSDQPRVAFCIPTLNAADELAGCLESIRRQAYPQDRIDISIADGGSTDNTAAIAARYGARVHPNPRRLCEPGVAVAIRQAQGDVVIPMAADNRLPDPHWLSRMTAPFVERLDVTVTFTHITVVPDDWALNRYFALTGGGPFYAFVYGDACNPRHMADRFPVEADTPSYQVFAFPARDYPAICLAQGVCIHRQRAEAALGAADPDVRAFDVLVETHMVQQRDDMTPLRRIAERGGRFAYVKDAGIAHRHVRSVREFFRKYRHRIENNLLRGQGYAARRSRLSPAHRLRELAWPLYSVTLVGPALAAWRGVRRDRDAAWWLHPVICATLTGLIGVVALQALAQRILSQRVTTFRARPLVLAGLATAAAYAALVAPGFIPTSFRYDTSLHGPHEARFLSGWQIKQHPRFRGNIVTRLGASQAVFEFPPISTPYPLLLKINIIPWEACRFSLAVNDHAIGTVVNTVRHRGDKHFLGMPPGITHATTPNRLSIINHTAETSTQWETMEIRNYRGTLRAPHWYLLSGFGPPHVRGQRLSPWRWLVSGLMGALLWYLTGPLRRSRLERITHGLLWGVAPAVFVVTALAGAPLVGTARGFWIWWLLPPVMAAIPRCPQWIGRGEQLIETLASKATTALVETWGAWWEQWLMRWVPHRWLQPIRRLLRVVTGVIAWLFVMVPLSLEFIWRWWRQAPMLNAWYGFAGLLGAATICWYLQWAAVAEWLGTCAFGVLVLGLLGVLMAPSARKSR